MLGSQNVIAFIATTDAARARAFYADTLGLRLVAEEPWALVFDAHGTMLRVQKVQELAPASHTVLGWQVQQIASVVAELKGRVTFERYPFLEQDEAGVWTTAGGAKVAWFKDPDGNVLSLTQL